MGKKGTLFTGVGLPGPEAPFQDRILIQARDLGSGQLLWERWEPLSEIGPHLGDQLNDLVATDARVFAVGVMGFGAGNKKQRFAKAYDALTGDALWNEQFSSPEFFNVLATRGDSLFMAGNRRGDGRTRLVMRAVDQRTGEELWRFERGESARGRSYRPQKIVSKGRERLQAAAAVGSPVFSRQDYWHLSR